jgi:Undecaprenyl-phosphate galactose phosphotransferase WbaP
MATPGTAAQPAREANPQVERSIVKRGHGVFAARRIACLFLLFIVDVSIVALALELAILIRVAWLPHLSTQTPHEAFSFSHYVSRGWIWLLFLVFYPVEGLYTQRRSLWNEVGSLTKASGLGTLAVLAAVALEKLSIDVSRITILLTGVILLVLMPVARYWTKLLLGRLNLWRKPILILGAAKTAKLVLHGVNEDPVLGYQVVGMLDDDPSKQNQCLGSSFGQPVCVLGPLAMAPTLMREGRARDILLAMPGLGEIQLVTLLHTLQSLCESIYVVPKMWGLPMMNLHIDGFLRQQVLMLKVSNNLAKPWNSWIKRTFDLLIGSIFAVFSVPLIGAIALLIKMNSKGPVLHVQERLGYQGRTFRCLKFRSMQVNGDEQLTAYLKANPQLAAEWDRYAKLKTHDPRLTPVGSFLRRWSLDEIPQIFNVLKGDMSLVGPRPYLLREKERIGKDLPTIVAARPGMTGFWQVNGKNHVTIDDRVRLEVWYVRNWSIWLDIIILVKTFRTVFGREGTH